jgi:hypothetical protein
VALPFLLTRGGKNIPLEVQRWQYFLRKQGIPQAGAIDGQFGLKTEDATKIFQLQHTIKPMSGRLDEATLDVAKDLGYSVKPGDYYDGKRTDGYPPKPRNINSPTNASRNAELGCFKFKQLPRQNRGDAEEIVIGGSCDGKIADWRKTNIVDISVPQLAFASDYHGVVTCHRLVAVHVQKLFNRWEELDLLYLIRAYEGAFNPRYKRGQSPGDGGHGFKRSDQVDAISNHAFGAAFDINVDDNPFDDTPQLCPLRGALRELVATANEVGFYWGGHFSSPRDGMHFEFAAF